MLIAASEKIFEDEAEELESYVLSDVLLVLI